MSNRPAEAEADGLTRRRFLNGKGCDGCQMVRFEGVQRTEDYRRQERKLESHAQ